VCIDKCASALQTQDYIRDLQRAHDEEQRRIKVRAPIMLAVPTSVRTHILLTSQRTQWANGHLGHG
jgi:hypothetical protein